jgi:regulator of replication initiation timing
VLITPSLGFPTGRSIYIINYTPAKHQQVFWHHSTPRHQTSLKAQVDELAAENTSLKSKADDLATEVTQPKTNQAKAQELADKRRVEAELRERKLQQRLQAALDSLHGKPRTLFNLGFVRIASVC